MKLHDTNAKLFNANAKRMDSVLGGVLFSDEKGDLLVRLTLFHDESLCSEDGTSPPGHWFIEVTKIHVTDPAGDESNEVTLTCVLDSADFADPAMLVDAAAEHAYEWFHRNAVAIGHDEATITSGWKGLRG